MSRFLCLVAAVLLAVNVGAQAATYDHVIQTTCVDDDCQIQQSQAIYQFGVCYRYIAGGSIMIKGCETSSVTFSQYRLVEDCSGYAVMGTQPTAVCLSINTEFYFNMCVHNSSSTNITNVPFKKH